MTGSLTPEHTDEPTRPRPHGVRNLLYRLRPNRGAVLLIVALSSAQSIASLIQPLLVNDIVSDASVGEAIIRPLLLLASLLLVAAILGGIEQYLVVGLGEKVAHRARTSLARSILQMPFPELYRHRRGDLLSRASSDTLLIKTAVVQGITQIISAVITFLGALALMVMIDAVLVAVSVGVVLLGAAVLLLVSRGMRALSERGQESLGAYSAALDRAIQALPTIRSLNATNHEVASVEKQSDAAMSHGFKLAKVTAWLAPVGSIVTQIALVVVLGLGGLRVASGALTLGDLIAFAMYLFLMLTPIMQSAGALTAIQQAIAADSRILKVENAPAEELGASLNVEASISGSSIAVSFDKVTFSYLTDVSNDDGTDEPALNSVSFSVPRNSRTALVGPSGAGKSTVLSLIEGFFYPTDGDVRVYGERIQDTGLSTVRSHIGYVQQEAPVLAGTLRDNLTIGKRDATDEECLLALGRVNLSHLADQSHGGLGRLIGDQGIGLSGGERQRLALARVLIAGRSILLLDEATSQVDSETEFALQQTLRALEGSVTQIIVAHRLSTVIDCDQILVFEGGSITASGTHSELLSTSRIYERFATQQHLVA